MLLTKELVTLLFVGLCNSSQSTAAGTPSPSQPPLMLKWELKIAPLDKKDCSKWLSPDIPWGTNNTRSLLYLLKSRLPSMEPLWNVALLFAVINAPDHKKVAALSGVSYKRKLFHCTSRMIVIEEPVSKYFDLIQVINIRREILSH